MSQQRTFRDRHIGMTPDDYPVMFDTLGVETLDALIDAVVPTAIRLQQPLQLPDALSEDQALAELHAIAQTNQVLRSCLGQGYYGTLTPAVIQRNVLENPAWYTAYTPYQPEISQGRLEALFNYQTMIVELTGLAVANASLLDEGTACAEAMTLCQRASKSKSTRCYVATNLFAQSLAVLQTRAAPLGIELIPFDPAHPPTFEDAFGLIVQYVGDTGAIVDLETLLPAAKAAGLLTVVAADPLALTLLTPPGQLGADICLGSTQRFGVPMGAGGPHAAFFAVADGLKRMIPGRLVGQSIDAQGRPAYRLTLQTREQHIRREKATSNICTAQVLLANIAGFYGCYHGPDGLIAIAERVHRFTGQLAQALLDAGLTINLTFFDTLTVAVPNAEAVIRQAEALGFNLYAQGPEVVSLSLDETTQAHELETLASLFSATVSDHQLCGIPEQQRRQDVFMTQPVFHAYRSETDMMRYLRKLADRDLALDRAMIPLGSCTMKLNAAAEMAPITWPEFAQIHPFAPTHQTQGYQRLYAELCAWLSEITGYAAISLQPNSGAQGEYAGLLAIAGYHASRGDTHRTVCLIPSSAHGTNPASAQMVGMQVVVVGCDAEGNIDITDLQEKVARHSDQLACLMVTYPSTHGVFETNIREICDLIHAHGGQVYLDGANLNAQVGLTSPALIGSDVSHLNLHKTFCIPHGGGGPGVGPIGVAEHLVPFLPGHPRLDVDAPVGPVSSAPYGSSMILPISWMYIRMMGSDGLTSATKHAILAANYIAQRLKPHYPVLYTGKAGWVAHECILDTRAVKESAGVSVDDVAKRLIDYGFHAPTMSWPVAGTLMIEPTESESLAELDRFCDAMIQIREEIREIETGAISLSESVLVHAPFTVDVFTEEHWPHPFSRVQAAYPVPALRMDRYWPPVGRIDNVYGDRNLVCSCAPLSAYEEDPIEAA